MIKHGDLLCANLGKFINIMLLIILINLVHYMQLAYKIDTYSLFCFGILLKGDSRAIAHVLGGVKNLSQDHNTSNPKERERVYSMGGTIKDNR